MGFLKDVATLNRMGREASRTWDPAAQLADAQAWMARANDQLAALTEASQADARLAATGTPATAVITAVRPGGGQIGTDPILDVELLVQQPGRVPLPATLRRAVPVHHVARLHAGATVPVRTDGVAVAFDWAR